jgi:dihydrofolate reductase
VIQNTPRLALIVAMARNRVIGRDGGLPWRLSADLKYFKAVTMGKPVLMGRKTFESILALLGKALPGRASIIITRDMDFSAKDCFVMHGFRSAVQTAKEIARRDGASEIMVIGGAEIYAQALGAADRLYLTEIDAEFDGDAKFPDFDRAQWLETMRDDHPAGEDGALGHSFVTLDRKP